jgi:hypothetical protein
MNEPSAADSEQQVFFSSKPRLVHMAINIAVAPFLLYLLGAWTWPPVLQHYIVFTITFLMAVHYARQRWQLPRLVLDANGLTCGRFYPADNIYRAEPSRRAVAALGNPDSARRWPGQKQDHQPRLGEPGRLPGDPATAGKSLPARAPRMKLP